MSVDRAGRRFRPSLKAWIVMTLIFGGMFAFAVNALFTTDESFWSLVSITGVAWGGVILWLVRFRIELTDDAISFRSLFRSGRLASSDVRKVVLTWDTGNGLQGPMRLKVLANRKGVEDLNINAQVFAREAISAVLEFGDRVATTEGRELEHGLVRKVLRDSKRPGDS